jgi:hypothetical protein
MQVEVTFSGVKQKVTISCSKPGVVEVVNSTPINVTIGLNKDGIDGLSAYQLAVKNGLFEGTEEEYLLSLVPNFSILGNYERDWAQDFLVALNT